MNRRRPPQKWRVPHPRDVLVIVARVGFLEPQTVQFIRSNLTRVGALRPAMNPRRLAKKLGAPGLAFETGDTTTLNLTLVHRE